MLLQAYGVYIDAAGRAETLIIAACCQVSATMAVQQYIPSRGPAATGRTVECYRPDSLSNSDARSRATCLSNGAICVADLRVIRAAGPDTESAVRVGASATGTAKHRTPTSCSPSSTVYPSERLTRGRGSGRRAWCANSPSTSAFPSG